MRNKRIWFWIVGVLVAMAVFVPAQIAVVAAPPADFPGGGHAVVPLGKALDVDGREVEGFAIIHYKEAPGKPAAPGKPGKAPVCYAVLASGAKWKVVEPYEVDPANTDGIPLATVRGIFASSLAKWEQAAGVEIFGAESGGLPNGIDTTAPDGRNEVMFGSWPEPNVIAITIVWGRFSGPSKWRELVEWDALFDQADFRWGVGDPLKMDLENIATHEFGHAAGMGDVYESACSLVTMYGYASEGETQKSTLEAQDITGIRSLYK
jgi:hypothetical protein